MTTGLGKAAADLRREFDLSFARAAQVETPDLQHLLSVRIGGDPYALRVEEIAGLFADRHIISIPTPLAELLGVVGFRGQVTPVYDLAALLGYPRRGGQRWLVLARHLDRVAFAFDAFEAQLATTAEHLVSWASSASSHALSQAPAVHAHVEHAFRAASATYPIIRLASVIEEVQRRIDIARYTKEP